MDTMTSYAQKGEDVLLRRIFDRSNGFYVDMGAAHPEIHSVTKYFYDRGWQGINIEPLPQAAEHLRHARPRDTTIQCAIGAEAGEADLFVSTKAPGLTSLDPDISQVHKQDGYPMTRSTTLVERLDTILDQYCTTPIDFLKIDAEGFEQAAVESMDFDRWRPRVVVIEATWPLTDTPSHQGWEPLIIRAGYQLAQFDGLNRFYAQDEQDLERLQAPVGDHDNYVRAHPEGSSWRIDGSLST